MKWRVTAASARGASHVRSGLPNQDACEFRNGERSSALRAVLAVSDGHGSARHFRSQVGSTLAVNSAVNVLYDTLEHLLAERGAGLLAVPLEEQVPALVERLCEDWRTTVLSDLAHNPFSPEELGAVEAAEGPAAKASVEQDPLLAYGATLLATAVTDDFILYLQLGDGDVLAVSETGETTRPLPVDERLIANQTTSLCLPTAAQEFRSTVAREFPALILMATDGYANSFRSEADFLKIGADYLDITRKQGIEGLSEELPEILAGASQEGSGDDITLGVIQRMGASAAGTSKHAVPFAAAAPAPVAEVVAPKAQRKQNRMWWIGGGVAFAAGLAILIFVYVFRVCCSPPPVQPPQQQARPNLPAPPATKPVSTPPSATAALPKNKAYALGGIELQPGDRILFNALQPEAEPSNETYAEVRQTPQGGWELVNLSGDTWTVQRPGKKSVEPPVGNGSIVLLAKNVHITFRTGVSATVNIVTTTRPSANAAVQE